MFPGQDPYLWDNRYNAIKELTKELAKVVVQKGPVAANQSMLQQIQELQRENARLKSARPGAPSPAPSTAPRTPVHTPPPKSNRAPKSTVTPKAAATPKSSGANPTPPSYRRPKDRQSTTETPDSTIRSLEDCWHSRRMDEAGSDQEQEPAQDEAKDDDATIGSFPALTLHQQVCPTRTSPTLRKLFKRSREQIRYPFLMSVKSIITSWLPSLHGFHIESARRRCLRFEQPATNC